MLTLKAPPGPTTYFLRLLRAVYEPDPRAERDARRGLRLHGIRVSVDRANRKPGVGIGAMPVARDNRANKEGLGRAGTPRGPKSLVCSLRATKDLP